jgi:hypothetical protein
MDIIVHDEDDDDEDGDDEDKDGNKDIDDKYKDDEKCQKWSNQFLNLSTQTR